MQLVKVELSLRNLALVALAALLVFVVFQLSGVVAMVFVAFILSAGVRPLIDRMERRGLPRPLGVVGIYGSVFATVFVLAILIASQFLIQARELISSLPGIYNNLSLFIRTSLPALANILPLDSLQTELGTFVQSFLTSDFVSNIFTGQNLLAVLSQTFGVLGGVAGLLITVFTTLIISIYMLLSKEKFYEAIINPLPITKVNKSTIRKVLSKIEDSLGSWLVGQLSLMVIIGLITYFLLTIPALFDPNFKLAAFAVPIAIIAGLLEGLPNVGPAITTIFTGILAIGTAGPLGLAYVVISFGLLQNIEGVFLVPNVMRRAVGLHPIITIVGILSALQLYGVIGAILVVPFLGIVQIILLEVLKETKPELVPEVPEADTPVLLAAAANIRAFINRNEETELVVVKSKEK